jgi:hypothetical protein
MSVGKRKIEHAKSAAVRLEQLGEPMHAEAVHSLCRSNSALIETCRRLQADLAEARTGEQRQLERLRREWGLDGASHPPIFATKTDGSDSHGGANE